jgi:SPX domain protein involved in polyphosphate accumulation
MKFGKTIRSVSHQPWADKYVDYKGLKKLLKPLENQGGTAEEESAFVTKIYAEIDKVRWWADLPRGS